MATPIWIDWDYDRSNSDTGTTSRYANYLRQHVRSFDEMWTDDPTVEFAVLAWHVATGPIMVPGLVRYHPRILGIDVARSTWNGEAIAEVRLVSPRPGPLVDMKTAGGDYFGDHRLDAWDRYDGIGEDDLARTAYLITEVRLAWQLPPGSLPKITNVPAGHDLYRSAVAAVEALVSNLNREVEPIIQRLN